jgi:hypothetical protein
MDEGPCMMEAVTDTEEGQALMRVHAWKRVRHVRDARHLLPGKLWIVFCMNRQ